MQSPRSRHTSAGWLDSAEFRVTRPASNSGLPWRLEVGGWTIKSLETNHIVTFGSSELLVCQHSQPDKMWEKQQLSILTTKSAETGWPSRHLPDIESGWCWRRHPGWGWVEQASGTLPHSGRRVQSHGQKAGSHGQTAAAHCPPSDSHRCPGPQPLTAAPPWSGWRLAASWTATGGLEYLKTGENLIFIGKMQGLNRTVLWVKSWHHFLSGLYPTSFFNSMKCLIEDDLKWKISHFFFVLVYTYSYTNCAINIRLSLEFGITAIATSCLLEQEVTKSELPEKHDHVSLSVLCFKVCCGTLTPVTAAKNSSAIAPRSFSHTLI